MHDIKGSAQPAGQEVRGTSLGFATTGVARHEVVHVVDVRRVEQRPTWIEHRQTEVDIQASVAEEQRGVAALAVSLEGECSLDGWEK
jgi:hypothetical protein